ncbi:competence/damage-inducible protein A [Halobacterium wangiae]|uniref:competence/damage-inducible protein A n=1 Tax=Halobacterium wangiae TaxID=2902623 RepID=UPI001E439C01|nr:competence/damage-inducible protein A [Halobacterium wangiae]
MATTAAVVTVGDELLAGDVENTNATWLASRLADRGIRVRQVRVVPDEVAEIAAAVAELGQAHTFVVTTGGLGSTPDDVTVDAVAEALERPLEAHPEARAHVEAAVAKIQEEYPEFDHDVEAGSRYPAGAQILPNEAGIAPGCVCGNVYVLPGIPEEMEAVFDVVAEEFSGDTRSRTAYSQTPESHLNDLLNEVRERFDVRVGCYPTPNHRRIRLVSENADALAEAYDWLLRQPEIDPQEDDSTATSE